MYILHIHNILCQRISIINQNLKTTKMYNGRKNRVLKTRMTELPKKSDKLLFMAWPLVFGAISIRLR